MNQSPAVPGERGSVSESEGIRVTVTPRFLPEHTDLGAGEYVFTYWVRIENTGERWAKLRRRYWEIVDSDGEKRVVDDAGVVGEEPELEGGESFEYSSWCPLGTDWGTMQGHYTFERRDGEVFTAPIGRFYLVAE